MSSPSGWPRPNRSCHSKGMGALLTAHLLATKRYGLRWSAIVTRVGFTGWGALTVGHILRVLCLELALLGPMRRTSMIRSIHWMNWCKGSSRRPTGGTWSCMSATRGIRRCGRSRYSPWSRGWWPYIATSSRCGVVVLRPMHSLHDIRPYLHCLSLLHTATYPETMMMTTMTTASQILTIISIRRF